ncbi:MAG: hypothetical protein J6A40_09895 [Bacteroides sp.]|nr:hypothetical protein [Bacteroides sp.]
MKALTNILTHMLMLLLMVALATCTTDDGADEVMPMDDGMVQLKVGMTVPNLKITTRAADEGETLNAIKGLCYDESGTLTKIADATDITTTTFNMRVPAETRTIHFLANLPGDCTLPVVWTTTEDALQNLTTKSGSMTYWGRTTFNSTPADCNITFYRNKARIFIKTADGSNVGTVGIAGVVNAYNTGMLVPYNGAYNFDLSNNYYPTVPTEGFIKGNVMVNANPLPTQYDVFEHPNTGTSQTSSLYAICLIGSKYYKVALGTPDEDGMVTGDYFPIIRNHKYVISVADVDDVDASLGADSPNEAVNLAPINDPNIKVEDVVDVVVTLSTSTKSLDYNTTSISNLILSVTVPPEVDKLTLNTPGFTVATFSDTSYKIDENTNQYYLVKNDDGSFTVNHPANDEEHTFSFRLTLNDNPQQPSYNLSCTAASNDANVQITPPESVTVSLNKVDDNENVYWMGASPLDYYNSPSKIPISAAKLTKGAKVTLDYVKPVDGTPQIGLQHAGWKDFDNKPTLDLSKNTTSFKITQELYNEIQSNKGWIYEVADAGMVIQGQNITLTKITIDPTEDVALTVNHTTASLYYDSDNTQEITVTVPVGKTLTELTITPSVDCFTITSPSGEMTATNGVYNYAPNGGVTDPVTFTIAPKSGYDFTNVSSSTLTFGGTGVDMNVSTAQTVVTLSAMPTVTFSPTEDQTIYLGGDPLTVTMTVPNDGSVTLSIGATGFTVTKDGNELSKDNEGKYTYTGGSTTFTFVPTSIGAKTISISGSGTNMKVTPVEEMIVTVKDKIVAEPTTSTTLYYDATEPQTVGVKVTVPAGVTTLNIVAPDFSAVSADGDYTVSGDATKGYSVSLASDGKKQINFSFTLDENKFSEEGPSTITFSDASDNKFIEDDEVEINVEAVQGEIVIWESNIEGGTPVDWDQSKTCSISSSNFSTQIPSLKIGDEITINYIGGTNASIQVEYGNEAHTKVQIIEYGNDNNVINCASGTNSYTFVVNSELMINNFLSYGMVLIGTNTSILSITAKETPTTK